MYTYPWEELDNVAQTDLLENTSEKWACEISMSELLAWHWLDSRYLGYKSLNPLE